jgi:TetR/AcrR family transcriptional repressor of nem operon
LTIINRLVIYLNMPRPANPATQARLVETGGDLVRRAGFHAVGVQEIASAASVPKGSFYNYFATKEAFGLAILDAYWDEIERDHLVKLGDETRCPAERVRAFFQGLSQMHADTGFGPGCLIGNLALEMGNTSDPIRARAAKLLRQWEEALAACLEEARRTGTLQSGLEPRSLAAILVEAFEGAVMRAKVERDAAAFVRFEALLAVFLPQLATAAPTQ